MKKRILSIVLAVLMLVSVLPVTAMAATMDTPQTDTGAARQLSVSNATADDSVHIVKSVNEDGTALTLEAYATNTMTTVTTYEPLDIVLVLDVSGSMNDPIGSRDNTKRIDALKTAVQAFIDNVASQKDSDNKPIENRISIVKFAGDKTDKIGDNTYDVTTGFWPFEETNTYNYTQIVKELTRVDEAGKTALTKAVNALKAMGATSADFGMELAQSVLSGRTGDAAKRKSVVIMFTDGEPNHDNGFDDTVASDAIKYAKDLKDAGTLVYTIGMFNGADPADTTKKDTNKYMHAMSSNYPSAAYTYYESYWDWNVWHPEEWKFEFGEREKNSNYYLSATNSTELKNIFQSISGEIGSLQAKVDASSVLSDTLSEMFDFDPVTGDVADSITVKKVPVTGKDADGNYTWGTPEDVTGVNVSVNDKKLEVKGFDYAENAVTANTDGSYKGYKLVVTIPIKPDTSYERWTAGTRNYDTNSTANGSKAGLEYGETGSRQKLELNESPNAPVTAYTVTYNYDNAPNGAPDLPTDNKSYIEGQTVQVQSITPVTVEENHRTYTFGGWTKGGAPAGGSFTMGNENVTLTGTWTFTENARAGVNYDYVSADSTPLPAAISTATGDYAVADNTQYYVGQSVANNGPAAGTKYTMSDGSGEWVLSWDKTSDIMTAEGVTFTGTWTFTPNSMVTLHYEIVVMDAGAPQPKHGTVTQPDDQTGYSGTDFNVAGSATTTDDTYAWTFHGWYTDDACSNPAGASITLTGNTTLYGYWTSVALVGNYKVTEYYMQADGAYDGGTEAESSTHALGEWTYTPDETKPGGYTLNKTESDLTKTITADGIAEFKVYYDLSSGSKVTKVAKVNGVETTEADVGDTIDYYITVSNEGGLDLTDLTLTDTFNRADLHFDEGEDYTVTPVEGEEGKWTITIPSLTVVEHEITIHATYEVVDNDSGRTLSNTVVGTNDNTDGDSTVTVGEVTHNNVVIDIEKTVTSKRGTAPKEGYVFVAYYVDESENEHELGRTTIYMSESATKDDPKTETGKIRFTLSKEEYAMLPKEKVSEDGEEEAGVPYLYVRELPGEDAFTEYDSTVLKGYVIPAPVAYSILPDEPTYKEVEYIVAPETNLFGSVFAFENIYKKSTSRVDPIKVGPQLNRDDHVAYIMGYPDGTVQPEGQITRAEACTIFFRLLTDSSRDYYFSKTNDYTDVNAGDWFNNAISTLSNAGIVTGYNDGTFRPNQPITRGEMAKIIANFANLNKGTKSFTDLSGHWSKTYVELAAGNGWIAGYPDGSFRPDQKITRAETVTMINRVLDRVPAKESRLLSRSIMLTFPDNNPGDWYYIAIQEASNSHEYQRSVYETTGDEMWTKLIDNVDWTKLEK